VKSIAGEQSPGEGGGWLALALALHAVRISPMTNKMCITRDNTICPLLRSWRRLFLWLILSKPSSASC
jgi:hypothetical protein